MRLFLDAHISGRRVAQALRDNGYDVRAVDEERALDGLDDESLFVLAADQGRILVTFNLKDFEPIMNTWAEAGRSHAGCILVASTLRHEQFGAIIAGIRRALEEVGEQGMWIDRVYWLSKAQTTQ